MLAWSLARMIISPSRSVRANCAAVKIDEARQAEDEKKERYQLANW